MLGFAPWVIHLLHSAQFGPEVEILRWLLPANIVKVMGCPLGFVPLAAGARAGKTSIVTETPGTGVFVSGIPFNPLLIGVTAKGIAFLSI
jgi:hypothetical protein